MQEPNAAFLIIDPLAISFTFFTFCMNQNVDKCVDK